ncbi:hypothetical protein UFOVP355_47 [uncultured Caudovirales phage]|uniref:Uncharacterized protein n=1 Tax=uncultured Caudovirales phage TaxID=2100421 RepID=A0A6J5M199_9CAUD|nr:hypothetical protein UFOVP355_47 [uncultured Caudovirales phage]CAB4156940.1 hypothetical protein UFOVP677_47 [uncultured Caudovirales phage]
MSMLDAYYGDYGMSEATARKKRARSSIANLQASRLGQQRGQRSLSKLTQQLTEGFQPKMAEYGQRGLAGPNVTSGIQRKGLERYAASMQESLGEATQQLQDEANMAAMQEANAQAELDDYLAQLELQKKQNIINAATALKQYSAY